MLCLLAFAIPARAEERIIRFVSDARIETSGALHVVETLTIAVEGKEIKRGFLRDFPTRYKDHKGNQVDVGFEVESVTRDGVAEHYVVESIGNGSRIKIGSAGVLLKPGTYKYEITYATTKQLGFFDGYDELYWNVTGNDWVFPIETAEAVIRLPPGAKVIQSAAYTGPQGAQGKDFAVVPSSPGEYRAITKRRLAPGEGFTVAVGFTKGVVPPPPPPEDTTAISIPVMAAGILALIGYYLTGWFRVGRDPPEKAIIPLFGPPKGLGPAAVRYVWRQGFDDKTLASAVLGIAVKGGLRIHGDQTWAIEKHGVETSALTASEAELWRNLPKRKVTLDSSNASFLNSQRTRLHDTLATEFAGAMIVKNRSWFWGGVGLSLLLAVIVMATMPSEEAFLGLTLGLMCALFWIGLIWAFVLNFRSMLKPGLTRKIAAVIGFAVMAPFFVMAIAFPGMIWEQAQTWGLPAFATMMLIMMVLHVLFARWLAAPTELGNQLMNEINGFRMYLETAEEDRLNSLTPPEKTPALFEKFLPYAMALDCENAWNAKFAAILAAAAVGVPAWYVGSNWDNQRFSHIGNDLARRIDPPDRSSSSYETSSSSSSPGSFSGSSGGGSSGGGGGGGGGSGW